MARIWSFRLSLTLLFPVLAAQSLSNGRSFADKQFDHRLVGGEATERSRYPYFARITDKNDENVCGGALIASMVVLCAAHCRDAKPVWVHIDGIKIKIKKKIVHSRFEDSDNWSDLRVAALHYIPRKQCQEEYDPFGYMIHKDMICAARTGRDACSGSSGSPLVLQGSRPSDDIQVGVVSWGIGCAELPGVYASLIDGSSWVKKAVKKLGSGIT